MKKEPPNLKMQNTCNNCYHSKIESFEDVMYYALLSCKLYKCDVCDVNICDDFSARAN